MVEKDSKTEVLEGHSWKVTEKHDGELISVRVGDKISITLPEHGTAGYMWTMTQLDTVIIKWLEESIKPSRAGSLGAEGKRVFVLMAMLPGITEIALEEKRPWMAKDNPKSRFSVAVEIS